MAQAAAQWVSFEKPFVGQPILAAAGFQPALFGDRKCLPAPKTPPERRRQARLDCLPHRTGTVTTPLARGEQMLGQLNEGPIRADQCGELRSPSPLENKRIG